MQFKKGDRVKFLNESGGGVVSRIEGQLVYVEIEDGFEIPTQASNLVKIDAVGSAARFFDEDFGLRRSTIREDEPRAEETEEEAPVQSTSQKLAKQDANDANRFAKGIYLALVPQDQRILISGPIDIYLLNHTGADILYNLYLRKPDGRFAGTDFGSVEPESFLHLFEVTRLELNDWNEGIIQVMFHEAIAVSVPHPVAAEFRIKPTRLMKEDNYTASPWFKERSILVFVSGPSVSDVPDQNSLTELAEKFGQPSISQKARIIKEAPLIEKHRIAKGEAEVDLHISALSDDYSRLSNSEILRLQKDYFLRTLDSAMTEGYRKVFYIHGIGNGTLRNTLMSALKEFEDVKVRNAPFARYGNGAIEVSLGAL
ncbi:MAG: DUF2027 domain-containing protein [Bacteroidota bacterium]|nr:DUF2027 domain-containing protein [Bacteroidota bacterium]